jgi:hypothetical protein
VINNLLEALQKEGFFICSYADDTNILPEGNFLKTPRYLMGSAPKIRQGWCKAKGLRVNPSKINVMVFASKYKAEPVRLLKLEGKVTAFTYSVKYLGGLLDPKLKWSNTLLKGGRNFTPVHGILEKPLARPGELNLQYLFGCT